MKRQSPHGTLESSAQDQSDPTGQAMQKGCLGEMTPGLAWRKAVCQVQQDCGGLRRKGGVQETACAKGHLREGRRQVRLAGGHGCH